MKRKIKVAGYVRVARVETICDISIENQISKIQDFVSERENFQLVKIFSDCGASGLTLERDALNELINDIHLKKIDCVIVCEISRLGRRLVEVENFVTGNFTKNNVRFISVLADNMDIHPSSYNQKFAKFIQSCKLKLEASM